MPFEEFKGKSIRLHICKTPGMSLWVALKRVVLEDRTEERLRELTKKGVRSFPGPVNKDCRCKECRYYRMIKRRRIFS